MALDITAILLDAIHSLNEMRSADQQIAAAASTVLIGEGADLDSMDLVNVFLGAEEAINATGAAAPNLIDLMSNLAGKVTVADLANRINAEMP